MSINIILLTLDFVKMSLKTSVSSAVVSTRVQDIQYGYTFCICRSVSPEPISDSDQDHVCHFDLYILQIIKTVTGWIYLFYSIMFVMLLYNNVCDVSYAVKSVRVDDISELSLVPSISVYTKI